MATFISIFSAKQIKFNIVSNLNIGNLYEEGKMRDIKSSKHVRVANFPNSLGKSKFSIISVLFFRFLMHFKKSKQIISLKILQYKINCRTNIQDFLKICVLFHLNIKKWTWLSNFVQKYNYYTLLN